MTDRKLIKQLNIKEPKKTSRRFEMVDDEANKVLVGLLQNIPFQGE